jgi:hypothetical protein
MLKASPPLLSPTALVTAVFSAAKVGRPEQSARAGQLAESSPRLKKPSATLYFAFTISSFEQTWIPHMRDAHASSRPKKMEVGLPIA